MATHSSVLVWRIPGTGEPGGLRSMRSHRVRHNWSNLAAAAAHTYSLQFSLVALSCPTLCDPMNHSTSGLPDHHQLLESTQTHAHWVSDAIQPSHPVLPPSPPAFNLSQHQGLFKWVSSSLTHTQVWVYSSSQSIGVSASTSVLPMNTQDWFPLG